jgi:hypothetical protein
VQIIDPALAKRSGKRRLGEAGPARRRNGANVDQQRDIGLDELP